jgi:hypothetical protein
LRDRRCHQRPNGRNDTGENPRRNGLFGDGPGIRGSVGLDGGGASLAKPVSDAEFPANRKITGNFSEFGLLEVLVERRNMCAAAVLRKFLLKINRENILGIQGSTSLRAGKATESNKSNCSTYRGVVYRTESLVVGKQCGNMVADCRHPLARWNGRIGLHAAMPTERVRLHVVYATGYSPITPRLVAVGISFRKLVQTIRQPYESWYDEARLIHQTDTIS